MSLPGIREWLFSAKTFAAAMLALYVAFALDLQRPYWSALTAFVVAQPFVGMVGSRALYYVLGTILGAAAGVAALTAFSTAPELGSLVFSLWVGLCVYASTLDKTPRGRGYFIAATTFMLVVVLDIGVPQNAFTIAVLRSEEIILGILCTVALHGLVFPRRAGDVLLAKLDAWFASAARLTGAVLDGEADRPAAVAELQRLTAAAFEIEELRAHAAYDTPTLRAAAGAVSRLQRRMQTLMSVLDVTSDRMDVLSRRRPDLVTGCAPVFASVAAWVAEEARDRPAARGLLAEIERRRPEAAAMRRDWDPLLFALLLARLRDLVRLWDDCRRLRADVRRGRSSPAGWSVARHRDHATAALSGLAAGLSVLLCSAFWIVSAWPNGTLAVVLAAIGSGLFAAMDDPVPSLLRFLAGMVIAIVIGSLYLLVLLPSIDGFPLLAAALALFYLPAVALTAMPGAAPIATAVVVLFTLLLGFSGGLNSRVAIQFDGFLNNAVALSFGLVAAILVLGALRSYSADKAVSLLIGGVRRDLARVAAGDPTLDRPRFEARMFDRANGLIQRLGGPKPETGPEERRAVVEAFTALRAGLNLERLRRTRRRLPAPASRAVRDALRAIAAHLRARDPAAEPMAPVWDALEHALKAVAELPPSREADTSLLALAGLWQTLGRHAEFLGMTPDAVPRLGHADDGRGRAAS